MKERNRSWKRRGFRRNKRCRKSKKLKGREKRKDC